MEGLNIRSLHYIIKTCTLNTALGYPNFERYPCGLADALHQCTWPYLELLSSSDPHPLTFYLTHTLTFYLTFYLALFLAFSLAFYHAFYLTSLLTVYLAFYVTSSIAIEARWALALTVEVRKCPLTSGGCGWGLAVPTEVWSARLRSGIAHWALELAVKAQLRFGAHCWSPAVSSGVRGWGPAMPAEL